MLGILLLFNLIKRIPIVKQVPTTFHEFNYTDSMDDDTVISNPYRGTIIPPQVIPQIESSSEFPTHIAFTRSKSFSYPTPINPVNSNKSLATISKLSSKREVFEPKQGFKPIRIKNMEEYIAPPPPPQTAAESSTPPPTSLY